MEKKREKKAEGYAFDPEHPGAVPFAILPALKERGIQEKDVLLLVKADLDDERRFCERYIILTKSKLILLSGITVKAGGEERFTESAYKEEPGGELSSFEIEDLASSALLTVKIGGKKHAVTAFSRTYREDISQFCRYANEYSEKGEFTPSGEGEASKKELFCPTCGMRYADPDAKICPKCRKRGGLIKRTFTLFKEYKVKLILVLLSLAAGSALAVVTPYLSAGFLYDEVLDPKGIWYGKILLAVLAIVATRILSMAVTSCHNIVTSRLAADMAYKLRKTIFSSINRLSLSFFLSRKTGGLMTQVDNDAQIIYWFFCDELPQFAISFMQVIAVSVIMFLINPLLALAAVIILPLAFFVVRKMFKKLNVLHGRRFRRKSSMNGTLSDMLAGVRVVKAFSGEDREKKRFSGKSEALAAADVNNAAYQTKTFPAVTLLLRLGTVLVWTVGGVMILTHFQNPGLIGRQEVLTYGMLATFLSYVSMVYEPLFSFADTISMAADSLNAMGRLVEVMDAKPDVTEKENALTPERMRGDISFDDLSFSYVPGVPVLQNVSFDVKAGSIVGIVGKTGAGKSTLANLLTRMYDPTEGRILIDGIDLRDLSFGYLRDNISIVSQDTYLFSGTVAENVRYARPDATAEEVFKACVMAGANEFIMKLRDGYDTMIGQGNADLSGGEKQRLSIARAILKDPKILILDEATASMDTHTEQIIQQALAEFSKGRTTLMIAHRLSTLRDADELVVLDGKTVAEKGAPDELIKRKGVYFELYRLQLEALRNIGVEEEG